MCLGVVARADQSLLEFELQMGKRTLNLSFCSLMLLLLKTFIRILETIGTKYKQTNKEGFVENFGGHPGNHLTAYSMYTYIHVSKYLAMLCFLTCLLACLLGCLQILRLE
jgi:hypothetical protein